MEISPYMLMLLTVYSFLFGMSAGAFNDINRIIRGFLGVRYSKKSFDKLYTIELPFVGALSRSDEETKTKKKLLGVLIFLQDILWSVYIGYGTVILNYYLNRGQFRLYTIVAVLAGIAAYYFTVGRLVILLSEAIIFFIKASLKILLWLISRPFVVIGGRIIKGVKKLCKKISSAIAKKKNIRYNKKRREELAALAEHGFLN